MYQTNNLPFTVVDIVVALTVKVIKYRFSNTFGILYIISYNVMIDQLIKCLIYINDIP